MPSLITDLIGDGLVVTDGSWGTQLHKRGLAGGQSPDGWNLSSPEKVTQVAQQYVEAGSRVILTNTFQASRLVLDRYGLGEQTVAINEAGVQISKAAAAGKAHVFASMGPTGKMLAGGDTSEAELQAVFEQQAAALTAADGIVIETMIDIDEACIAVKAAKQTGLPVVASLVYDSGPNKDRTMMGTTVEAAVEALSRIGVDVVGANCGQGIEAFVPICQQMRAATDLPLWIKPNAGLPTYEDGKTVFHATAEEFVSHIPDLIAAGANFIGGCCGTDETFIRALARIALTDSPN